MAQAREVLHRGPLFDALQALAKRAGVEIDTATKNLYTVDGSTFPVTVPPDCLGWTQCEAHDDGTNFKQPSVMLQFGEGEGMHWWSALDQHAPEDNVLYFFSPIDTHGTSKLVKGWRISLIGYRHELATRVRPPPATKVSPERGQRPPPWHE